MGPEIQRNVTAAHLPTAVARLNAEQPVSFGAITVDRHTVSVKDRTRAWGDLTEVRLFNGEVHFEKGPGRPALPAVLSAAVPNLYVFLSLTEQLRK